MFGSRESNPASTYKMCPSCRGLIERDASVCPLCGSAVRPARARGSSETGSNRILGVIPMPSSATALLIAVNIAMFGITWYLSQVKASDVAGGSGGFADINPSVVVSLGAKIGIRYLAPTGQWWRLVTAMFLHFGLLHIFMNMWCLVDLGPMVESLFTKTKFIVLYLVTGVIGFALSAFASPGVSAGASSPVMGLIGILIGVSFHHGGLGKTYRSQLWRWVIYIGVLGLLGPMFGFGGVDNAAHIGGFVSGLVLGYLIPEGEPETRRAEILWNTLSVLSVLVIAGSFALMALQLNSPLK
jgi:rhomboid protease GluP